MIKAFFKKLSIFPYLVKPYDFCIEYLKLLKFTIKILFTKFNTDLVFFFPFYHTGGAEKVHLDIVNAVASKKPIVFFTGKSYNDHFKSDFFSQAKCYDLFFYIRKQNFGRKIVKAVLKIKLNNIARLKVLGSNNSFFYEIIPLLKKDKTVLDLIHAFTFENEPGAEKWSLPLVNRINKRIVINQKTKQDIFNQYIEHKINKDLIDRIVLINNKVSVSNCFPEKENRTILNVLYVGRNGEEKRVNLVAKIAERCYLKNIDTCFYLVGENLESVVSDSLKKYCVFTGNISYEDELIKTYRNADILLITSTREGFPMTIMEAMANGVVPVSTNVGGISHHIAHGENGFLIESVFDEEKLIEEALSYIEILNQDRIILKKLSNSVYIYAKNNFSEKEFNDRYRELLK